MPIIYKPRTRYNATSGIQSAITVADPPSGYGGQPHTMASQHYQSHSCVPVVCTGFVQGTKKSKQQSNSPCCQIHLQRLYVYGAHVTNRSKSFILDLGHWRPCRKFCQFHEFGNDEFLGIRQINVILWKGNMFFKWKRIEWECSLKRGDSCGGKVCA